MSTHRNGAQELVAECENASKPHVGRDGRTNPHVVIIGCGFAGLWAARAFIGKPVEVTVVDRANHHLFQPLLYQVATAGLSAPAIAAPIRQILRRASNITTLLADVRSIDLPGKAIRLDGGDVLTYDFLIVATGATHSYFGQDQWASFAPGLKTLDDAIEIRRRILLAFERAERESSVERRREWLTFAVVGAGPTGVELAGTLAEIARHTLRSEFRRFDSRDARIVLIEGTERVLPTYPSDLSEKAQRQLERLRVDVRTGCRVTGIDAEGVSVGTERMSARTVLWAAGIVASPLGSDLGSTRDRAGRILVESDLSITGNPNVFVAGDLATVTSVGKSVPGIASAAKQMGRRAALNVLRRLAGEPTVSFEYRDYGLLATIGRAAAVAVIGRVKLWGFPAWLLWLCAHIYFLIGFRNRLVVMIDWAWAYWTFQRYARIIFGDRRQ
jgi:NADH:quinone reductase (non-electrogenic)